MSFEAQVVTVRAVTRALAILESFAGERLQSLAEVTRATGLDKGTTRRLLITMMGSGFIVQDPATQKYGLGRVIATLAPNVIDGFDLRAVCVPVLNALATEFQLTAFLSVYEETGAVCLERVHDMKGLEVRWWSVGGALPLNCGGAPKLLLAYQAQTEIDRAVAGPLPSLTARSITDEHRLREELTKIRERGWELAIDDVVVGLSALAVPVLGRDNKPICAISLAGLTPQMQDRGKPLHLKPLIAAASTIAARLSGAEGGGQI
jgi:IclR family KDG regulon transcriptional repressor